MEDMRRLKKGASSHPAKAVVGGLGRLTICVLTAVLAIAGTAQAAVPRAGAWQSGSTSWEQPHVSFGVVRPPGKWNVLRVSFPSICDDSLVPRGWTSTTFVRALPGGRFTTYGFGAVVRGRFVTAKRAVVTVRPAAGDRC